MQAAPPASTPALRPLGVGDVIDRVFALYRARALGLFILGELLFVAIVVAWVVITLGFVVSMGNTFTRFQGRSAALIASDPALTDVFVGFIGILIVGWIATLLVGAVFTGAVIDAAAAAHLGQPRPLRRSFAVGFQSSLRIFFAGLLASIVVLLVSLVFNVVGAPFEQNIPILLLLSIVNLVVSTYIQASWFVSPVVATIERRGPVASLRRSWQLSGGFRWRIVGLFLLLVVLFLVLLFLGIFVIGLLTAVSQSAGAVALFIAVFAAVPLCVPLFFGTMTVLYYDLRVRKEGLDLQLAAEAMPRA